MIRYPFLLLFLLNLQVVYSQQRPLTAADFPQVVPKIDESLRGLAGKDLTERLLLAPYDGTALRLALDNTGPEFMKGTSAEELIAELSALRAESMKQLLPEILAPLNRRNMQGVRLQSSGAMLHPPQQLVPTAVVSAVAFFAAFNADALLLRNVATFGGRPQLPHDDFVMGGVNEYEYIGLGHTINVREEITYAVETRHVRYRKVKRETVEQNEEQTSVGRHVVERGVIGPEPGSSTVKSVNPRRLRPTSTHRVTTETIQEVKVERCPDAMGITRGETLTSITVRVTAAATGTGTPALIQSISKGNAKGQVNEAATLSSYDWEVTSQTRNESLSAGQNFHITQSMTMRDADAGGPGEPTFTIGDLAVNGVGSSEEASKLNKVQSGIRMDMYGQLLDAYNKAENEWRNGGCVELVIASGVEPRKLQSGEVRRLMVEARHSYEPSPTAVPVTGTPAGGTLTPTKPVQTPSAAFTFKSDADGKGGAVTFKSVSRRGIAKNASVDYIGSVPAFKVAVTYMKTGSDDLNMKSNEDMVALDAYNQRKWEVNYSYGLIYYPATAPKDGEQVMIMPEFESNPDMPKTGKTIMLYNTGYSDHKIMDKPIELKASPVGAPAQKEKPTYQSYFSGEPLLPSVSFLFKDNDLVFFSSGLEFPEPKKDRKVVPEEEGELSSVTGSFGIEKGNKKYFPLKAKKVTDPNSPYKWVYEFEYKSVSGYGNSGEVIKQGSKEVETATIQIWKNF